jgi:hypothetical protein
MAGDRLHQHINVSGNARVHFGDNVNSGQLANTSTSRAQALLEWLHYPRMTSRKESVKDTHADTFQWILESEDSEDEPNPDKPNPGFRAWLERGSGIYWIAGKAASGKSTLMKLITEHSETRRALDIWAGSQVLVYPLFYFWYGGTQTQRSQLGMLRSLLHELLLTNKTLVPVAFPLWTEKDGIEEPEFSEVAAAFLRTLAADERKICFFIDGLDEYEGDSIRTAALANYLGELAKSSANVKLVVSSRPLHELQVHIKSWPHLMLQDLTSGDISTFVEDKLRKNGQMVRLESQEPTATAELVNELVSRASGVFLWVYVVVQSLLDGLESRDKVADLTNRVRELPTELSELFSVMLGRINLRYRAQAFRLLYITQQLLPHVPEEGVSALVLSYAEELGYMTESLSGSRQISSAELEGRQQELEVVVRSRCLGLLEVSSSKALPKSKSDRNDAKFQELATNYRVDYVHKSVAEYLDDIDIRARAAETSESVFDVNVAILNALTITCQYRLHSRFLKMFSHSNRQAEQSTKKAQSKAVDELDTYLSVPQNRDGMMWIESPDARYRSESEGRHWANYVQEDYSRPCPWHDTTLAFAIRCGWELHVVEKLNEHRSGLPAKQGRPLLDYAIRPEPMYSAYVYGMNPKIVLCLLERGADPNAEFNGYSAWSNALYSVARYRFDVASRRDDIAIYALQVAEVMKLLLAYGATKKASCVLDEIETSAADAVHLAMATLDHRFPQEVRNELREVLAIIEDNKSIRGGVRNKITATDHSTEENQIAPVSFAGVSRSEPNDTLLSQKSSLSQRIKAKLLKRIR